MRRIPLALALVGAVIAAGCAGGKSPAAKTDAEVQKGVANQYYFVNLFQPPLGGIVTSDIGGINCGASAQAVSGTEYTYTYYSGAGSCGANGQTQIQWAQTVVLTATPQGSNVFIGWAGDCSGVGTCTLNTLTNGADKTVVAIFGPPNSGHGDFTNPAVHAAAAQSNTLACANCHGASFEGVSIAPACTKCHEFGTSAPPAGPMASPESCQNCHATVPAHAITGKVVATATTPVTSGSDLTFTVNVKVDGVNVDGLVLPPARVTTPPTPQTVVYRYAKNAAREGLSVIVPNERFSLPVTGGTVGNATLVGAGNGNYNVTIINGNSLVGDQTFLVRLQSAVVSPTMVYATAVTHKNNIPVRDFVSDAACVNCHADQVFREREASGEWHHGANPYGVQACVVCHSVYGSTSRSMGGDRLTAYVHGVHNSHAMPPRDISATLDANGSLPGSATALFTVTKPDGVYARNDGLVVNTTTLQAEISSPWSVGFPGYLVNCSICHDTPARRAAILALDVSASTCFSCHDNMNGFPTFEIGNAKYTAKVAADPTWEATVAGPHRAQPQPAAGTPARNACATCHDGTTAKKTVGDYHTLRITERNGVVYKGVDLSISEGDRVTMSIDSVSYASTTLLSVKWSAKRDNVAVDPCQNNTDNGPVFVGITTAQAAANAFGLSASNMSILLSYAQGNDWVNAGVGTSPGQPPSAPTLQITAPLNNGYTTCAGNVATSLIVTPSAAAIGSATKGVVALQGKPQITFTDPGPPAFARVIQLRSTSPVKEFVVADGTVPASLRRAIVSNDKCLACHPGSLYQHGGNRVDSVDLCVMCHNPAANEKNNRVGMGVTAAEAYDGKAGETYDLRTMVHAIHSAGETSSRLVYYRSNGIYLFGSQAAIDSTPNWPGAGTNIQVSGATVPTLRNHNEIVIHYPRALNDCNACHVGGSELGFGDQTQRMAVTVDSGTSSSNQTDDVLRGAGAQSCTTCHQFGASFPYFDGLAATANIQAHVNATGFAPQAFPAGRGSLVNFATCGFVTCP